MKTKVLDKGFIEVVDSLGNDLTVVNSARVSFGKRKTKWDKGDERLVRYLHVVGIETTSNGSTKDHAWNEISGRYVPVEEFYIPEIWRKQSEDNKQASEGVLESENNSRAKHYYDTALSTTVNMYNRLINNLGVAKEQARVILPLSQYTEVYWTASFQAIMNFIELRNEKTSQIEIQEYAKAMLKITHHTFPKITEIWAEAHGWEMDV